MDPIQRLNESVAEALGWQKDGLAWTRRDKAGIVETMVRVPTYTDNFIATWQLVDFAALHQTEYSLFMMIYDRHQIYMASFIKGLDQRTSTGECPRIATCKAFLMMFYLGDKPEKLATF